MWKNFNGILCQKKTTLDLVAFGLLLEGHSARKVIMIKIHFVSLSVGASVDQQTGSLSVFDILEEIRTPQVPLHLQSLVVSLALAKLKPGEFVGKMMIHLLTPDGRQQMVGTGEMKIPQDQNRMKAVFRFGGFPVSAFGAHRFVLSCLDVAGTKIAEAVLDFDVIQVAQVAQSVEAPEKPGLAH